MLVNLLAVLTGSSRVILLDNRCSHELFITLALARSTFSVQELHISRQVTVNFRFLTNLLVVSHRRFAARRTLTVRAFPSPHNTLNLSFYLLSLTQEPRKFLMDVHVALTILFDF